MSTVFEASYRGICGYCSETIHPGDPIRATEDDGWVHDHCPEPAPDPDDNPAHACPTCWLIHAGECP